MTDFTMTKDGDGIATITWDTVGKSMNVMTLEAWDVLEGLFDDAFADGAVKGVILTSGKPGSFAGGMDLNVIAKMKEMAGDNPAKGLFDGIMNAHRIMRKIELAGMDPKTHKGGKPVACVMPGTGQEGNVEIIPFPLALADYIWRCQTRWETTFHMNGNGQNTITLLVDGLSAVSVVNVPIYDGDLTHFVTGFCSFDGDGNIR